MIRDLNEKEIQYLGSGYRLLADRISVNYSKFPNMKGVYKVFGFQDKDPNHYNYSCNNIKELKGFFDGYFKGLNQVFGDVRR